MNSIVRHLIRKEFIQIRRNAFLPRLIFIFPVMIMLVMPWVMNFEVRNIRVSVVDDDRSPSSQRLVHRIEASNYFRLVGQKATYQDALSDVEHGRSDLILHIKNTPAGEAPSYHIAANAVDGTKAALGTAYIAPLLSPQGGMKGDGGVSQRVSPLGGTEGDGGVSQRVSPLGGTEGGLYLYNPHLNYRLFMIPALMTILVMLFCGFLPALNIVGEKESGTIEQINVTPVKKWQFILAKLIPYWFIAMLVMTVCFLLSWLVYGIVPQGNILWLYLLAMLLALFFSGLGLVISNYSDTLQQAMLLMWFFVVMLMLLSGLFTPTRSMPQWAQYIVTMNPAHYFIDAMRTVFVRGGGFFSIWHQLLALTLSVTVMGTWAVISYRKNS